MGSILFTANNMRWVSDRANAEMNNIYNNIVYEAQKGNYSVRLFWMLSDNAISCLREKGFTVEDDDDGTFIVSWKRKSR